MAFWCQYLEDKLFIVCPVDNTYNLLILFGHQFQIREIEIDDIRVRCIGKSKGIKKISIPKSTQPPKATKIVNCYFEVRPEKSRFQSLCWFCEQISSSREKQSVQHVFA